MALDDMSPSSGYLFHYTTTVTSVLTADAGAIADPNAGTTIPYPIPANSTDWLRIKCISRPTGIADDVIETAEHRCGDPEAAVIENVATGFKRLNAVGLMTTFTDAKMIALNALKEGRTLLAFLFTFPALPGQTKASRFCQRARLTKVTPVIDENGAPIMLTLEFQPEIDVGKWGPAATS